MSVRVHELESGASGQYTCLLSPIFDHVSSNLCFIKLIFRVFHTARLIGTKILDIISDPYLTHTWSKTPRGPGNKDGLILFETQRTRAFPAVSSLFEGLVLWRVHILEHPVSEVARLTSMVDSIEYIVDYVEWDDTVFDADDIRFPSSEDLIRVDFSYKIHHRHCPYPSVNTECLHVPLA